MPQHDAPRTEGFPCWVDLSVEDVDGAADFYRRVLGWQLTETAPEYGGYRTARRDGRLAAGIGPRQGDDPDHWVVYLAVADADRTAARAKELGGSVYVAPLDVVSQGRMAILSDPTGAVFGVWQANEHHGFQASAEPGFFGWAEVNTADAERARSFYTELFGASSSGVENPTTTYYGLSKDGETFAGILQMTEEWAGIPPHWMVYFEVDDIDSAVGRAKECGGAVAVEPFDTPLGRIAVVGDRGMAPFSLLQRGAG